MPYLSTLPHDAVLVDVFRLLPNVSTSLLEMHQALMRGPSPLSAGERELIAAFVSGLNACRYCHGVHSAVAEAFGIEPSRLEALLTDIDNGPVDDQLKPVLKFVKKLVTMPRRITSADADAVLDAGWPETTLLHATFVTGLFSMMNRIVLGLGIEADEDYFFQAGSRLQEYGYAGLVDLMSFASTEQSCEPANCCETFGVNEG